MNWPRRGEVWLADLDPVRGHEQAGRWPVLVVSADRFNSGPAGLVVALPLTSRIRGIPLHVRLAPPEGGVKVESAVICDTIRSMSRERLGARWGRVAPGTLATIERILRVLLRL